MLEKTPPEVSAAFFGHGRAMSPRTRKVEVAPKGSQDGLEEDL